MNHVLPGAAGDLQNEAGFRQNAFENLQNRPAVSLR